MKSPRYYSVLALLTSITLLAHSAHADTTFDGKWKVSMNCPTSPQGEAAAFSFDFPAIVKDNVLHGEHGTAGQPGWMQINGTIQSDGDAVLIAEGLTHFPAHALNNVPEGTPYKRAMSAHFESEQGLGSWITTRTCTFTFTKQ